MKTKLPSFMNVGHKPQYANQSIEKSFLRGSKLFLFLITSFLISCAALGFSSSPSLNPAKNLPAVDFDKIIYVKRATYVSDHFYTDFINGVSPQHLDPENGIYTYDLNSRMESPVITSREMPGGQGIFGRYSLSFDATKIVFDYKPSQEEGFRIWEVNLDGTGLRQLTFPPPDESERIARYNLLGFWSWEEGDEESEGPMGACYWEDDDFCEALPESICLEEDGVHHLDQSCQAACPDCKTEEAWEDEGPLGACSWPDDNYCEALPESICLEEDGVHHLDQSCQAVCPDCETEEAWEDEGPLGACSWPNDNYCEALPQNICLEEDGQYHPDQSCQAACPDCETEDDWGEDDEADWNEPDQSYNHHTDDMHPTYTADGSIIFTSTRAEYIVLCNSEGLLTSSVLHRIDADGGNLEQLTRSPVSEFSPITLSDGRIMYSRWEYVDKGSVSVKALWAMNPDGANSTEIFGNNHNLPPTIIHGRPVPGAEHLVVAVGAPHFPQGNSLGTLLLIDTTRDIRTSDAFRHLTPGVKLMEEPGWSFNGQEDLSGASGRLYTDPFPLREGLYLATVKSDEKAIWTDAAAYDLYLLDDEGTHWKLLDDPDTSLWQPTPLKSVPTPPVISTVRHPELEKNNQALLIVSNVYTGMEDVAPGTVKWLRINEVVPRFWSSQRWQYGESLWEPFATSTEWYGALWPRVQWGIVPVEADGSAYFTVPADRNIFLQALDENYMEVQRERTYVNYRPGEIRSCAGCHERTGSADHQINMDGLIALQRAPSVPGPQPGEETGQRVIHYESDIQPIFDNKCIACHNADNPEARLNLSRTDSEIESELYFASYLALVGNDEVDDEQLRGESTGYLGPILREDAHAMDWAPYLPPYSLGAHQSQLITTLRTDDDHKDLLTQAELIRIITWVDSNAQYYGSYYGRHHSAHEGHPNYRVVPTFDEAINPEAPSWHR